MKCIYLIHHLYFFQVFIFILLFFNRTKRNDMHKNQSIIKYQMCFWNGDSNLNQGRLYKDIEGVAPGTIFSLTFSKNLYLSSPCSLKPTVILIQFYFNFEPSVLISENLITESTQLQLVCSVSEFWTFHFPIKSIRDNS